MGNEVTEFADKSKQIIEKGESNNLWPQDLNNKEKKQLAYISAQYGLDPFFSDLTVLGGNPYVTASGLKRNAHESDDPPASIQVEPVKPQKNNGNRHFQYKAKLWKESTPEDRPFVEYGEASPDDCNRQISKTDKDLKAMARTRAVNRVIRLAYNISLTSAEEMSGYDPQTQEIEDVTPERQPEPQTNKSDEKATAPGKFKMPFGKNKGTKLKDLDEGYLNWIANKMEAKNEKGKLVKEMAQKYIEGKNDNPQNDKPKKKKLSERQKEIKEITGGEKSLIEDVQEYLKQEDVDGVDELTEQEYEVLKNSIEFDSEQIQDEDEIAAEAAENIN